MPSQLPVRGEEPGNAAVLGEEPGNAPVLGEAPVPVDVDRRPDGRTAAGLWTAAEL